MRLENENQALLEQMILKAVGKYVDLEKYRLFFFGSRVAGSGDAYSDIDVGIEGDQPLSPSVLAEIRNRLEDLPILYSIDFVDFKKADAGFRQEAERFREWIYPR